MVDKKKKEEELSAEPVKEDSAEKVEEEKVSDSHEKEPAPKKEQGEDESVSGELIVEVSESKTYGWIFIVGLLLVLLIAGGGLLFYFKGIENVNLPINSQAPTTVTPVPTQAISPTPTATASAKLDKEEFGIEVLNGSGKGGQAAVVQKILEDGGFKVDSIGNAEDSDHKDTLISARKSVSKEFLTELRKELGKVYVLSKETGELKDSSNSDIEIIVGSERK
ncbi:MAG: hypothetical protein A2186_02480 [Candidatus Levybacteria bacterium RIFOXYA1_FULL_41_10]|nr:MAG: Transcriptional regulator-like protein [Candidatus Levybacteria bacterium GW2011_GWA1_39_34]KKR51270.1 MAG: Transcriptional regulator-like protein [Candidatus Levybacteria bacterium GW2011_GWC1_40_19]KKR73847.1 MAG: Transcriptional regulator-like protein [Candidatus Levybacteria bacterium GW2011_GWC2_40_7]KKR94643.1 MAG: Transcriptional regulator-like protein [Candidatus Levybacteria bacterium GW2011_GWA2_41_15]KKS02037.1 MAG: Transcriptional regulator-like protein [Candidatus Levybacte